MGRVAKAVSEDLGGGEYRWVEQFRWDDDEFEDRKHGTIRERSSNRECSSSGDSTDL